jgi:hypothetical protein
VPRREELFRTLSHMFRFLFTLLPLVLLGLVALAGATEVSCPQCQVPVPAPVRPWNVAGGVDSDGCTYAVDSEGTWRVVGLDQVVDCARCGLAFDRGRVPAVPPGFQAQLDAERKRRGLPGGRLPARARHELAAWVHKSLGVPGLSPTAQRALVGELLLRAAWAARGEALGDADAGGYRPRDLREARKQLDGLEVRARFDPHQEPEVQRLDGLLVGLEGSRLRLEARLSTEPPAGRFRLLREHMALGELERQLLARKAVALRAASARERLTPAALRRALWAAWLRGGHPTRWRAALARAQGADARSFAQAAANEQRLLKAAAVELRAAAATAGTQLKARLLFLVGECARRRGEADAARQAFADAMRLAPGDAVVGRAKLLQEPR